MRMAVVAISLLISGCWSLAGPSPYCGDGFVRTDLQANEDGFEECDDGNVELNDGCDDDCNGKLRLLSWRRPATQSTTYVEGGLPLEAGFAVDGQYNFGPAWFSSTQLTDQPWWQVDLEAARTIREIALWKRGDGGGPMQLANFVIYTSMDGLDWRVFARDGGSALRPSRYEGRVEGRYVRVQLQGRDYLTIMEAEVFGY